MLQQTQVARVLEKYPEFLKAFPTIQHLAQAPLPKVLRVWQGMGYNRRARYLKETATIIVKNYGGVVPSDPAGLRRLLGVGPYTAGAIACFAYNKPVVFLDTNIRKALLYIFFQGYHKNSGRKNCGKFMVKAKKTKIDDKVDDNVLLAVAKSVIYRKNPRKWHYALMDYGALMLHNKPELLKQVKGYHKQSRFKGSSRYWRSKIIKHLLQYGQASREELQALTQGGIKPLISSLERDGLVRASSPGLYRLCK